MPLLPLSPAQPELEGWLLVAAVHLLTYLAAALTPSPLVRGYCIDPATRSPQLYRLNGFRCWALLTASAVCAVRMGVLPGDALWARFWPCARAGCAYGLLASFAFFARGRALLASGKIDRRPRCPTADAPAGGPQGDTKEFDARGALAHWYCGLSEFNPGLPGGVDAKMHLYLIGAVMLQLNLLSACAAAAERSGGWAQLSPGIIMYAGCLSFFIAEYCYQEVRARGG